MSKSKPPCPDNTPPAAPSPAAPCAKPIQYNHAPTLAEINNDPSVSAALQKAWTESNPNAPEVPRGKPGSIKVEQGGWIIWNKRTMQLEVQRVGSGTRDSLGPIVGTRPPDNADQQVVGWFHTHPNTDREDYVSDPSPGDMGWQNHEAKVPGIIKTHDCRKSIPYP